MIVQRKICDVTGAEDPCLDLTLPNHNFDTGQMEFHLSHIGAVQLIRKMVANSSYCLGVLREASNATLIAETKR